MVTASGSGPSAPIFVVDAIGGEVVVDEVQEDHVLVCNSAGTEVGRVPSPIAFSQGIVIEEVEEVAQVNTGSPVVRVVVAWDATWSEDADELDEEASGSTGGASSRGSIHTPCNPPARAEATLPTGCGGGGPRGVSVSSSTAWTDTCSPSELRAKSLERSWDEVSRVLPHLS